MIRGTRFAAVLAACLCFVGATAALAAPTPDDPKAMLDAIKTSPQAKLGPWLSNIYAEYKEAAAKGVTAKTFKTKNKALRSSKGMVGIDAYANDAAALTRSLKALGATKVKARGPLVSAQVPVKALGQIAALASLRSARPVLATVDALPPTAVTQGDVSLNGPQARAANGVDGSGLTVGTLSDTMNCNPPPFQPGARNTSFAQDIASGELPANTTILDNGDCAGAIDEGRGMSQLIHDVAPGAGIAFHTAFNSEFDFAEGIIELADAGADVIVDDVRYFAEPFFMDGMIAQAVDIVSARGVPYYSSAGNQARNSYENDFRGINVALNQEEHATGGKPVVRRFHNFGTAQAPSILQPVFLQPTAEAGFTIFSFQWDQPHLTATTYARLKAGQSPSLAVGAESDLDMVFFDHKGHVIRNCPPGVARGITCQITGDPNIGGDAVDVAALFFSGPPKTIAALFRRLRAERRAGSGRRQVLLVRQPGRIRRAPVRDEQRHLVRPFERGGEPGDRRGLVVCHGAVQHQRSRAAQRHADTGDRPEPVQPGLPERLLVGGRYPDLLRSLRDSPGDAAGPPGAQRDGTGRWQHDVLPVRLELRR